MTFVAVLYVGICNWALDDTDIGAEGFFYGKQVIIVVSFNVLMWFCSEKKRLLIF